MVSHRLLRVEKRVLSLANLLVFVMDKTILEPVSPWVFCYPPVSFILRMIHIISWSFLILEIIWESGIYSSSFVGENQVAFLRPE